MTGSSVEHRGVIYTDSLIHGGMEDHQGSAKRVHEFEKPLLLEIIEQLSLDAKTASGDGNLGFVRYDQLTRDSQRG